MPSKRRTPIRLRIPFYRQHYDFTCGPASLMMAMHYLQRDIPLTKDLEIDIWREGNMVEVYGTSRYGIAYSAAIRGFGVRVTSNTAGIDFVGKLTPPVNFDAQVLKLHFYERRARCRRLGVEERRRVISANVVYDSLLSGRIPLVMTNASLFGEEDLPHWVVVAGMDDEFIYFNNPLDANPRDRKYSLSALQEVVGYKGEQFMVEIWKNER
ncbi:MAG: peptidase C39 family protein [Thermoprotei archaeon]